MTMQSVCPECSTANPASNAFCGSCGASLEGAKIYEEVGAEQVPKRPRRQRRLGCWGLLLGPMTAIVLLACLVGFVMLLAGDGTPTSNRPASRVATRTPTPTPVPYSTWKKRTRSDIVYKMVEKSDTYKGLPVCWRGN